MGLPPVTLSPVGSAGGVLTLQDLGLPGAPLTVMPRLSAVPTVADTVKVELNGALAGVTVAPETTETLKTVAPATEWYAPIAATATLERRMTVA